MDNAGKPADTPTDLTDTLTLSSEHPVAAGGFSDIFKAVTADGQVVAVKVVRIVASDTVKKCCERETKFWHTFDHPHILKFLGTCIINGRPGLVSLWLSGGTALQFVKENPNADRLIILSQAGSALEYLHQRKIAHGDVKAANILIGDSGEAFLSDFGLARVMEQIAEFSPTPTTLQNAGSIRYMAPELFLVPDSNQKQIDRAKVDVYAFGCTVLELLTCERPFAEVLQDYAVPSHVMLGRHPQRPLAIDDKQWALCVECWRKDPNTRPSMADVVSNLIEGKYWKQSNELDVALSLPSLVMPTPRQGEPYISTPTTTSVPVWQLPEVSKVESDTSAVAKSIARSSLPARNPKPAIFYGRDDYVNQAIDVILSASGAHLAILGSGGIGKTTIARAMLHDKRIIQAFHDNRHFISCEAITSPALLVDTISLTLGVPSTSSDRLNALLNFIESKFNDCRVLVILDNFETLWDHRDMCADIDDYLEALGSQPSLSLIVTMRGSMRPPGINWTHPRLPPVETLKIDAARLAYKEISSTTDDSLDALLVALDCVPLAVTLMARLGQAGISPTRLLQRWNKERTTFVKDGSGSNRMKSVEVSIRLSLDSNRMRSNPDAQRLLSVLSFLPAGAPNDQLASIAPSLENVDAASTALLSAALAYYDNSNHLNVLSPIRTYMLHHHFPSKQTLDDIETCFFKWSERGRLNPGWDGFVEALNFLKGVERNMEAVISRALTLHPDDRCMEAALNFSNFLYWTRPREAIMEQATEVARTRGMTNHLPRCLYGLARINYKLSKCDLALSNYTEAQSKFEGIGDLRLAAYCLMEIGEVHRMLAEYDRARTTLKEAIAQFKKLGNRLGAAQSLQNLGNIDRMQSKHDEARSALTEARSEFEAIGNRNDAASCLWSLGEIRLFLCELEEARKDFTEAMREFDAIGNQTQVAWCLNCLGDIHRQCKDYDKALEVLTEAKSRFDTLGDRTGAADCVKELGNVYRDQSMYEAAFNAYMEAESEFDAIGNRYQRAGCLEAMGRVYHTIFKFDEARDFLTRAKDIFSAIGNEADATMCLGSLDAVDRSLAKQATSSAATES